MNNNKKVKNDKFKYLQYHQNDKNHQNLIDQTDRPISRTPQTLLTGHQ